MSKESEIVVNGLLSISYKCLSQYFGSSDKFMHYLLGINGAILGGFFLEIEKISQFFTNQTIFCSLLVFLCSAGLGILAKFCSTFRSAVLLLEGSLKKEFQNYFSRESRELSETEFNQYCLRLYGSFPIFSKFLLFYYRHWGNTFRLPYEFAFRLGAYQQYCLSGQLLFLFLGFIPPLCSL